MEEKHHKDRRKITLENLFVLPIVRPQTQERNTWDKK